MNVRKKRVPLAWIYMSERGRVCAHGYIYVCVCVYHCLAVEIMFSVSASVQGIKRATVPRVSCSIRLGQQIDCKRVVVSIGKCH